MGYLKFKADQLFDGEQFRDKQVLITRDDGTIENIVSESAAGDGIQQFQGMLLPGFINCHCHLELSHLKDVIPPHTGLINFLCDVVTKRGFPPEVIQQRIKEAEKEMADNGIVAVGDIGNTADTAAIKSRSKIHWHNFVEVLSFTDEKAVETVGHYQQVAATLKTLLSSSALSHKTSLVPHAPYTISPLTFRLINEATKNQVISIHNQEHPAENDLYQTGGGEYLRFFRIFGMDKSPFPVTGKSSLQSVLPYFNNGQTIILVHNTSITEEDITWANSYAAANQLNLLYCLCINANLYIENKIPPVELLLKHHCSIVLGTDSYSSNWQLSIAREVETLQSRFPHIPLEKILTWATANGSRALGREKELGKFNKGTKPGITLMQNDYSVKKLA